MKKEHDGHAVYEKKEVNCVVCGEVVSESESAKIGIHAGCAIHTGIKAGSMILGLLFSRRK